jgi:hypothetical protein
LLDSHGSEKFREVYDIHKELIRVNLDSLRTLNIPFDGIAVDLEWINLPRGNNNREFEGLMKQWRESLEKEKKLYYFATLTNDDKENKKRGYNTDKLSRYADSPLTMLYVVESGFSLKKRQLSPNMSENRANTLLQFYKKNSLEICYSMHRAWFAVYKRKVVELQLTDAEKQGLIFKKMDDRNPFIKCSTFFFADKTEIRTKEKKSIKVNKKNEIFFVEARKPEIASNYFIWEYFDFHRVFIQK